MFAKKIGLLIFLTSINVSTLAELAWVVKIVNETDQKIKVNIRSSQKYPTADFTLKECSFKHQEVEPNSSRDFKYKDINDICIAPCTKLVKVISPVTLSANNPLTSCSNVIVTVKQDESGQWSIEYRDWTDDALELVEERKRMPLNVRNMCDKLKGRPIQSISVFRQPIQAGLNELITILIHDELRKLNYDDLYHTGFIIECQGKLIILERNNTVSNEIVSDNRVKHLERRAVTLPQPTNYDQFIINAMKDDPNFWKYHPITNNCQLFVLQCLEENGVEISEQLHKFIYQDAGKLLAKNPIFKDFAVGATSLANRIDNLIEKAETEPTKIDIDANK
jgi:hypothetical protein